MRILSVVAWALLCPTFVNSADFLETANTDGIVSISDSSSFGELEDFVTDWDYAVAAEEQRETPPFLRVDKYSCIESGDEMKCSDYFQGKCPGCCSEDDGYRHCHWQTSSGSGEVCKCGKQPKDSGNDDYCIKEGEEMSCDALLEGGCPGCCFNDEGKRSCHKDRDSRSCLCGKSTERETCIKDNELMSCSAQEQGGCPGCCPDENGKRYCHWTGYTGSKTCKCGKYSGDDGKCKKEGEEMSCAAYNKGGCSGCCASYNEDSKRNERHCWAKIKGGTKTCTCGEKKDTGNCVEDGEQVDIEGCESLCCSGGCGYCIMADEFGDHHHEDDGYCVCGSSDANETPSQTYE